MKEQLKRLRDLIRVDLITMRGGKGSTRTTVLVFILFMIGTGFCISPLAGLYIPFLMGAFFVPTLFQNEIKYHSEKMWALLPVERKELVNSRYILFFVTYTAAGLLVYLLMVLAMQLRLWRYLFTDADGAMVDIVELLAGKLGFTPLGYFNLCYFGVFSFGMVIIASSLRKYFREPEKFNLAMSAGSLIQKSGKKEWILLGVVAGIILLYLMIVAGILPLDALAPALVVLIQLLSQLAKAANGFLLAAVFLTIAAFRSVSEYISSLIEYDQREI